MNLAITDLLADDLSNRMMKSPGSRAFHVTATFPGHRFNGSKWLVGNQRECLMQLEQVASRLFDPFKGFYYKTLQALGVRYRRRVAPTSMPYVMACIDDKDLTSKQRYPHIHSIWIAPEKLKLPLSLWFESVDSSNHWTGYSDGGILHANLIEPSYDDFRSAVAYAAKLERKASALGFCGESFLRTYPS
jgi:hypothetical protein